LASNLNVFSALLRESEKQVCILVDQLQLRKIYSMNKLYVLVSIYLLMLGVPMPALAELAMPQLAFDMFNQSVNAGTNVALGIRYQQQQSYQLVEGDQPASQTGWESHSTLTTGLFPLVAGKKIYLSYVAKADVKGAQQPVLWTEVRYFDQYGVNIDSAGGQRLSVSGDWRQNMITLSPSQADIAYAEVWFVKYENGQYSENNVTDADNDYALAIYLSDIKLKE
jgi:hypothetical protein